MDHWLPNGNSVRVCVARSNWIYIQYRPIIIVGGGSGGTFWVEIVLNEYFFGKKSSLCVCVCTISFQWNNFRLVLERKYPIFYFRFLFLPPSSNSLEMVPWQPPGKWFMKKKFLHSHTHSLTLEFPRASFSFTILRCRNSSCSTISTILKFFHSQIRIVCVCVCQYGKDMWK